MDSSDMEPPCTAISVDGDVGPHVIIYTSRGENHCTEHDKQDIVYHQVY